MKDVFISEKEFPPLDDLFILLKQLEKIFNVDILDADFVIGRKQMYFTFLHETLHAFIRKKAPWVFELTEDEEDFIDEVMVRFLIDDILQDTIIFSKVDDYYNDFVRHRTDLKLYGYNLQPEVYDAMYSEYLTQYSKDKDINEACRFIYNKKIALGIKRDKAFSYTREE